MLLDGKRERKKLYTDHLPTILMLIDDIARVTWSETSCCCLFDVVVTTGADADATAVGITNISCMEFIQEAETDVEEAANDDRWTELRSKSESELELELEADRDSALAGSAANCCWRCCKASNSKAEKPRAEEIPAAGLLKRKSSVFCSRLETVKRHK